MSWPPFDSPCLAPPPEDAGPIGPCLHCQVRHLAVCSALAREEILALETAGALDPGVPIRTSFVFGSGELLAWLDANPRVEMLRTERTNDPALIAANPAMTSINSSTSGGVSTAEIPNAATIA